MWMRLVWLLNFLGLSFVVTIEGGHWLRPDLSGEALFFGWAWVVSFLPLILHISLLCARTRKGA
jgi:hypothetical protein